MELTIISKHSLCLFSILSYKTYSFVRRVWVHICWQIGRLVASINSPCVRHKWLGEFTIRVGYASFLITIIFSRVDSAWGLTRGVTRDYWQIEGLAASINSSCICRERLGEHFICINRNRFYHDFIALYLSLTHLYYK